ncbi:hypothetical protein [Flavobacterium granuli]|uniref:Uncharacterized protein n=1 Tax=Flavobacterium granuli TaxID=280093 RepID=A0A1M5LY38_9FLAO|nr:hypothetical protein [Flavobacterium granuli]PRZ24145.1 hypothetical protein BC624_104262 [Flavobacterium granuli]SHG69925.1 hypothetical protein SAMN05443373_103262 [Flavobacterium granuli]
MNNKNFLVSGVFGGITNFLLGWLLYGFLFKNLYPQNENTNLLFIFLGYITFGLFMAYIFTKWAGITNPMTGFKTGATIGLFTSLSMNFFMYSNMPPNFENISIDIAISILMGAFVGAVIAAVNGKLK